MNTDNPYEASTNDSTPAPRRSKKLGTGILVIGLLILAYGATAFWLINTLPPNGGASGRLPSLYVMGVGLAIAIIGLIARDFRSGRKGPDVSHKGIPASYGILGLIAILIILFFVISRL